MTEPSSEEVRLKVAFCGICGTDVHVYHGMMDTEVPYKLSEKVLKKITKSNDVKLILEKHGEHRLSKNDEIETIKVLLNKISKI